jgi:methylated-DNA-protein-cysteine methyltransferase related protein
VTALPDRAGRIADVVRALGPGEVASYGDVAEIAGYPRNARLVGNVLATDDTGLPWWRVVASNGRLVPGNEAEHARLLVAEGVRVRAGRRASHVVWAPDGRRFNRRPEPTDQWST